MHSLFSQDTITNTTIYGQNGCKRYHHFAAEWQVVQHNVASTSSGHTPGTPNSFMTDKPAAAIQKPATTNQSAQSVMAARLSGKNTGGRGAAAERHGNNCAADRDRGRGKGCHASCSSCS